MTRMEVDLSEPLLSYNEIKTQSQCPASFSVGWGGNIIAVEETALHKLQALMLNHLTCESQSKGTDAVPFLV